MKPVLDESAPSSALDAAFDFASCPASYNINLQGPSRYRLIPTGGALGTQSDLCDQDKVGATHLVVFDSLPEVNAVAALVDSTTIASDAIWIGAVQLRAAARPDEMWISFDDQPLMDQWFDNEPNDGGGHEDHGEQFAVIMKNRHYFTDVARIFNAGALCECDGKPVGPTATAAIAASR
ncbi:MAG TPA: hypothetical protein VFK02_11185 [Kofleriaceae bacterium]|nr:hypothetical protein [Kofleriaceae bacterium]